MSASFHPVRVDAHLDPDLSRWQWLVKWFLAIPHYVVLAFLWVAFVVTSVVAFFAILFTGRYPRAIFDFNVGVLRWTWRVAYYSCGALGTDRYPPFTLEERSDYPAHLQIDHPAELSRGLVLVKWWLLAIPQYLVVGLFLGGTGVAIDDAFRAGDRSGTSGGGLIGLLVLVAAVVLLFTGRYPRPVFDLVLGLDRWVLRVAAYASLMTDVYPPFRLDQGGDDPATLRTAAPAGPPTVGQARWPADPELLTGTVAGSSAARPWTAGRVVALVAASVVLLVSACVGLASGALVVADRGLREDGFIMSGTTALATDTYAIATTSITLDADLPSALLPQNLLGDVKVTVTGRDAPMFLGIARTADASAYLRGVEHATVTDVGRPPAYDVSGSQPPATLPADAGIWVVQAVGTGTQQIVWPARSGHWTLVVMNADGSRNVRTAAAAGATVPALDWLVPTLAVLAVAGLALSTVLFVVALRRPSTR
jgi:hypothetical protein